MSLRLRRDQIAALEARGFTAEPLPGERRVRETDAEGRSFLTG
jgi:hypothetical protein